MKLVAPISLLAQASLLAAPVVLALLLQILGGEGAITGLPQRTAQIVTLDSAAATVPADRRAVVSVRFHVGEGFHINSHTPRSGLLMATNLALSPAPHLALAPVDYPKGQPFFFAFDPQEKLDVYAGEFVINIPVTAERGEHTVNGTLEYQACDRARCFPPKSLPVSFTLTAR